MKENRKYIIAIGCLMLLCGIILSVIYINYNYIHISMNKANFTETTEPLNNPDTGYCKNLSFILSDDDIIDESDIDLSNNPNESLGYRYNIVYLNICLYHYRNSSISNIALRNIESILNVLQKNGMRAVVRFAYDFDNNAFGNEPYSIDSILGHMTQLHSLLCKYDTTIMNIQGCFTGNMGLMEGGNYTSVADMTRLLSKLASVSSDKTYISIPSDEIYAAVAREYSANYKNYASAMINKNTFNNRLGVFYTETSSDSIDEQIKALYEDTPTGGVIPAYTSNQNDYIDLIASLNPSYFYDNNSNTLSKLISTDYTGTDPAFKGKSLFAYLSSHLGYRYVIKDFDMKFTTYKDQKASFVLYIENKGFAKSYTPKKIQIHIRKVNSTAAESLVLTDVTDANTSYDPCTWSNGSTIKIPFSMSPYDYSDGEYQLTLSMTDEYTEDTVAFANTPISTQSDEYLLGTIKIHR